MPSFSQRHSYTGPTPDISIREDAPESIRSVIVTESHLDGHSLREIACKVLRKRPDPNNWSAGNVWSEAEQLLYECLWFKAYDIAEAIHEYLAEKDEYLYGADKKAPKFAQALNTAFSEEGIGWQFIKGKLVARGDEGFQEAVKTAASELQKNQRPTAASHIQSAVKALSERPKANAPGAVSHATNAVECLLNDITGQAMTLGKYLDKHPNLFHPAMRKSLDGIYGFASDAGARHGKEGIEPTFAEAQFAVTTCAGACSFLTASNPKKETPEDFSW